MRWRFDATTLAGSLHNSFCSPSRFGSKAPIALKVARADSETAQPAESLADALQVIALLKTQYVDPVSSVDLMRNYLSTGTIGGMLSKTLDDPYTRYMDKAAFADMKINTRGSFFGIGLYIGLDENERLIVVAPIDGTPAKRAGIQSGDHIAEIDGKSTRFMSTDQAASLMRGPKGTTVTLLIERGTEKLTFTIRAGRDQRAVSFPGRNWKSTPASTTWRSPPSARKLSPSWRRHCGRSRQKAERG